MIYWKSLLTGIFTAIVAVVVWVLLSLAMMLGGSYLASRQEGSGGIGFVIMSDSLLLVALSGFVAGCVWQFWRLKAR